VWWFFIETNSNVHGNDAVDLARECRWKHCVHFKQLPGDDERYGVQILPGFKQEYVSRFNDGMADGTLVVDEECGTCNEHGLNSVLKDLKRQLMSMHYDRNGNITGKGGEGSFGNDDLAIAALMSHTWPSKARTCYYREYRKMLEALAQIQSQTRQPTQTL
jgi:hypothetical protein